ncbi:MAG: ribonuclease PH [Bdellovibrionales bacterium]
MRSDARTFSQLRPVRITPHISDYAEGSALIEFGKTKVLCTASYDPKPPQWLQGSGEGWITAEYGMLPRSTHQRIKRDKAANSGRTQEISRLIGRSLRAAVDTQALGERQIMIDCDVLHADGGTRTAAVTGGYVALALALKKLHALGEIKSLGLVQYVAAISVGLHNGQPLLDLNYDEDVSIGTDMNFVMTNKGEFVELQGTAEETPFTKPQLLSMLEVAEVGCRELFKKQSEIVGSFFPLT